MPTENRLTAVVDGASVGAERVYRSRAVWLSDDYKCTMLTANTSSAPFGIAQEWSRQAPGTLYNTSMQAGVTGDEIMVYGAGSTALAECGNTVTAGGMVTVDSTARIVNSASPAAALSTSLWDIGVALEDGTAGDVIRMRVMPINRGW